MKSLKYKSIRHYPRAVRREHVRQEHPMTEALALAFAEGLSVSGLNNITPKPQRSSLRDTTVVHEAVRVGRQDHILDTRQPDHGGVRAAHAAHAE